MIKDIDVLLMSKLNSDAFLEPTKIKKVKSHAKYAQQAIIAI